MRFVDSLKLKIQAGKGGDGIISFRTEAHVDRGGPDGGDGGKGGDIFVKGTTALNTLYHLYNHSKVQAKNGSNGRNKNRSGRKGESLTLEVPLGTVILDENNSLVCDVLTQDTYLIATGGAGGRGNARFRSSKNPAPRLCENGDMGQTYTATFDLKYISDVGFVGKPSAGKSSLLNSLSNAKSKVGDYDFTTLSPKLGLVKPKNSEGFVLADLPGIIAGASKGKGLGFQFLKHIERARVIVFVVDAGSPEKDPVQDLHDILFELACFKNQEPEQPKYVFAHKSDLPDFPKKFIALKNAFPSTEFRATSVKDFALLQTLKVDLSQWLYSSESKNPKNYYSEVNFSLEKEIQVERIFANLFEISGSKVMAIYNKIPLNSEENLQRFNHKLKQLGVWDLLIKKGVQPGDTVRVSSYEFSWLSSEVF